MRRTILAVLIAELTVMTAFAAVLGFARPVAAAGGDIGWGTPAPVVNHIAGDATMPGVGMDTNGNAIAGWVQANGERHAMFTNAYTNGVGWAQPTLQKNGPDDTNQNYQPSIAIDAAGNAIAVWSETWYIMASRYTPGTGWEPPVQVGYCCTYSAEPQIAMTPAGDAIVVWFQWDGARYDIFANRYIVGTGWMGVEWPESTNDNAYSARVGLDIYGDAFVVWYEWNGANYRVASNIYVPGFGWLGASYIDSGVYGYHPKIAVNDDASAMVVYEDGQAIRWVAFNPVLVLWGAVGTLDSAGVWSAEPHIASNPTTGDAIAIWTRLEGTGLNLYSSNYVFSTSTWSAPSLRDGLGTPVNYNSAIAMNRGGRAVLAWSQPDAGGTTQIYAWRYDPATGWVGVYLLSGGLPGSKGNPAVAMSSFGTGIVVYQQMDGTRYSLRSNRFTGTGFNAPLLVEFDNAGGSWANRIASNAAGQGAVVWWQNDGPITNLYGAVYDPARGWTSPTLLEFSNRGNAVDANLAVDAAGNVFVVWTQWDLHWNIWSERFTRTGGWEAPYLMESLDGDAGLAQVGFDPLGNAVAVWYQWDGGTLNIYGSAWSGGIWRSPIPIDTLTGDAYEPQLAVSPSGTALVVWHQYDGAYDSIYYATYTGGTWSAPALAENLATWSRWVRIAMNDVGQAILIWHVYNGATWNLFANRWDGFAFTGEVQVENSSAGVSWPVIAIDGQGNGLAAWHSWDGSQWKVWRAEYRNGAWQAAQIVSAGPGDALDAAVAADRNGNMMLSWRRWDGAKWGIESQRYTPGAGWAATGPLAEGGQGAQFPRLAMDDNGDVLAVYMQYDGERWLPWVNRYTAGDGAPFLSLTAPAEPLTNDPLVVVGGYTNPSAYVTINGVPVIVDSTGFFKESMTLADGSYSFDVVATNLAGNSRTLTAYVTVDTTPPALSITSPVYVITNTPVVWVSGMAEPGATVDVDGIQATVDAAGNFGLSESLAEGPNMGIVTATDAAGNSAIRAFQVTVDTVAPPLIIYAPTGETTNYAYVTVSGKAEGGAVVTIDGFAPSVNPDGTFSSSFTLPDGTHTFDVRAHDVAGNEVSASPSVTVDTGAPSLTLTSPASGSITNNPTIRVEGDTEAGVALDVNGMAATVDSVGHFSMDLTLGDGTHTILVTATDAASNVATASATVTVDTKAPLLVLTAPTATLTNNPVVVVSGFTDPGTIVSIDGTIVTVSPTGLFSRTVTLPDGTHTFDIEAADAAGNEGGASVTITVDTTAPSLTITAPANNLLTRNPIVTVTGTTEPGAGVVVNGVVAAVDPSGAFSVPLTLPDGTTLVRVEATDPAGNTVSGQRTVVVDTVPPSLALLAPVGGLLTANAAVQVSGRTEVGATVTVDGTAVTVAADGSFATTVSLPDGPHVFTVVATDLAGNTARATSTVTVDTRAPSLTISAPTNGATTSEASVVVTGTTEVGARVVLNGVAVSVASDGTFSARIALAPGLNAIAATATDAAGNAASLSVAVTYNDPMPGLRNELNTTKNDLTTTKNDLATTQNGLTAAQQTLASLGTEALGLLVLAAVALLLGVLQFVQLRSIRRQLARSVEPRPPPPEEGPK